MLTVDTERVRLIRAEEAVEEHVKARHCQSFAAIELSPALLLVFPSISGASIQEDRNKEEINQSFGDLKIRRHWRRRSPRIDERTDPGSANVKVPPSTVGRDLEVHKKSGRREMRLQIESGPCHSLFQSPADGVYASVTTGRHAISPLDLNYLAAVIYSICLLFRMIIKIFEFSSPGQVIYSPASLADSWQCPEVGDLGC